MELHQTERRPRPIARSDNQLPLYLAGPYRDQPRSLTAPLNWAPWTLAVTVLGTLVLSRLLLS